VGNVAGIGQCAVATAQQVGKDAEHHRAAGIADVHVVVDGRPAHVHGGARGVERLERFDAPRQAVEEVEAHGATGQVCDILPAAAPGLARTPHRPRNSRGSAPAAARHLHSRACLPGVCPPMKSSLASLALLLAAATLPAWGQETRTVIQAENVRFAYAQVLQVTPVYQTLTATAVERECEPPQPAEAEGEGEPSRLQRVVGRVRDALGGRDGEEAG